jgi:hypothetical protein
MITHIKEVHTEQYSNGSRTLGVLLNYEVTNSNEHNDFKESFVYMFRETEDGGMYVFFNTMFDMWSFMLYSEDKMKRAYMSEADYDKLFDAPHIDGKFTNKLVWV